MIDITNLLKNLDEKTKSTLRYLNNYPEKKLELQNSLLKFEKLFENAFKNSFENNPKHINNMCYNLLNIITNSISSKIGRAHV